MLVNALFYVALIAAIALTFVSAGLAMTRTTIHRMAQTYVTAGYQRAAGSLEQTLSADLQSGALPSPLPAFTPIPPACVDPACSYETAESIALTQTSTPAPSPTCDPAQSNCASNEQTNPYVQEGRITARITVTVTGSDGSVLATRSGDVILRTLRAPPYVVLAGARDGSFAQVLPGRAPGDDAGIAPLSVDPCAAPAAGVSDDTVVRAAYRNRNTNACTDGSSWRTSSYSSSAGGASGWSP